MTTVQARRATGPALRFILGLLLPVAIYYALRAFGISVFVALLTSALASAAPAVRSLRIRSRPDGLSVYFSAMLFGGVAVSLVSGSEQFLLARDAVLTGVTGAWFLLSVRAPRPLAYLISRPLAEGRLRWPADWEHLWAASPPFRRMWRTSSVIWGLATLGDAVARVVMAYTLPPDSVPALSTALYALTSAVLFVGTNIYYGVSGVFDPRSPLRRAAGPAPAT